MNCQDLKAVLSEYVDDGLSPADRDLARGHIDSCPGCARELKLTRGVGELLRGLRPRPLPSGFLTRLSSRRNSARAAEFLPRALGYAFAAVVVGVVVLRNQRAVPVPRAAVDAPPAEVAQAPTARTRPAPFRDEGSPVAQGSEIAERPLLPETAEKKALGNPAFTPARANNFDNAAQAAKMQQESDEQGLRAYRADEDRATPEPFLGRHPGTPEVAQRAEQSVQQLIAMRHAIEEASGKQRPVPISGATAPVLYDKTNDDSNGKSLDEAKAAPANAWSGDFSGGNEGSRLISDADAWQKLWSTLSPGAKVPPVDFSRQEVVAIFLGERPTGGYSAAVSSVESSETAVTVRWLERVPKPGVPPSDGVTTPYTLRVIPKSDLPVRFEKQP